MNKKRISPVHPGVYLKELLDELKLTIVPEGIIFQSQTAYKQLRKMLVEEYLVAVVSLPAGVFNPYSGVKTSILILDKLLARKTDTIAFFKVENDGFGLGAQRREIDKNDLPQAHADISEYLRRLRAGESVADFQPTLGLIVEKEKVAANGEYNLSGERYREGSVRHSAFPLRQFEDVCTLEYGAALPKEKRIDGPYPVVGSNGITGYHNEYLVEGIGHIVFGAAYKALTIEKLKEFKIPLPPTATQQTIIAEIETEQALVAANRELIARFEQKIQATLARISGEEAPTAPEA